MELTPKFNPVSKDSLFYNKWRYCISFRLDEVSCLKELNHEYIDSIIQRRKHWRDISQQRLFRPHTSSKTIPVILTKRHKDITDTTVLNLHKLADLLINTSIDFKLVTSVDQAWVYSNDMLLIHQLSSEQSLENKCYTEALINRPKNTIKLKDSTHAQRSYFKTIKLSAKEKQIIFNFFNNQQDIKLSPSLKIWFEHDYYRTQDHFFIDHDGDKSLLLLALVKPGLIRKTVNIIS